MVIIYKILIYLIISFIYFNFIIIGLCQEKLRPTSSSRFKKAEWIEGVIKNYEQAANLGILYLQELDNKENQLMLPSPLGGNAPAILNSNTASGTGIFYLSYI